MTTISLSELATAAREQGVVAINIHVRGDGWRVQIRHHDSLGFTTAQETHPTISDALREHFPPQHDPDELLV